MGQGGEKKSFPKSTLTTTEGHWVKKLEASLLQERDAIIIWSRCTPMSYRHQIILVSLPQQPSADLQPDS